MENPTTTPATTAVTFNPDDYSSYRGESVNIINDLSLYAEHKGITVTTFGANVTVQYIVPIFGKDAMGNNITILQSNMPVMIIGNGDYITVEVTIPNDSNWLSCHNLLHFSSYFLSSSKNGDSYTVFGSLDDSIFFKKQDVQLGNTIKICITASKVVADYYESQEDGWYVSRIPADYNQAVNQSTYACALRLGTQKDHAVEDAPFIQHNVKFTYFKSNSTDAAPNETYTADDIKLTAQMAGRIQGSSDLPNQYNEIKTTLDELAAYTPYVLYPYLSNFADPRVNYPIISFYDSIDLPFPVNCQANNTNENYFMSNEISFGDVNLDVDYLHILFANQADMGAALTSNIQIYTSDSDSHGCIKWPDGDDAIINTAADLPPFSAPNYPHNDPESAAQEDGEYPVYGIYSVKISDLISENTKLPGIIITERFSYNPNNLNYTDYSLCHTSKAYVGPALSEEFLLQLKIKYPNIDLTHAIGK